MAAKIVIKIKDTFFLQEDTFTDPANAGKMVIGSNFPFQNNGNAQIAKNFNELAGIYPTMSNVGNQGESRTVFQNLIDTLSPIASNGKIESLFWVIDATSTINLSRMAKDGAGYIGENLLNFYIIEVNAGEAAQRLNDIDKLKNNNPLLGIDYVYVRDELADFKQVSNVSTHNPSTLTASLPNKDFGEMINAEAFIPDAQMGNLPKIDRTLVKGFVQQEPNLQNLMSDLPKKERGIVNETVQNEPTPQSLMRSSDNLPPSFTLPALSSANSRSFINNIKNLFAKCGITNFNDDLSNIKVIDMEQGWDLTDPDLSNLPLINNIILGNNVLGGGCNFDSAPPKKEHGTNTLNILFKNESTDNLDTLNGLCKNAGKGVASVWFRDVLLSDEKKEAGLAALLGYEYTNPVTGITMGPRKPPVNIGDIVLLELQTNVLGGTNLPVEISPAMFEVIAKGVGAGFIIIEAAGNGPYDGSGLNGNNLDTFNYSIYKNLKTENSKAIMVGAMKNPVGNIDTCNYGRRIDCYCYADDDVFTKFISNTSSSNLIFNSTSLASAIVAALIANLQSYAKANKGRPLTITEIQNYLKSTIYYGPFSNSKKPNLITPPLTKKFGNYLNTLPRTRPTTRTFPTLLP